jgi:hypothetical protein
MRPNRLAGGRRAASARVEEAASVRNRHSIKSCAAISAKFWDGVSDRDGSPGPRHGCVKAHIFASFQRGLMLSF